MEIVRMLALAVAYMIFGGTLVLLGWIAWMAAGDWCRRVRNRRHIVRMSQGYERQMQDCEQEEKDMEGR